MKARDPVPLDPQDSRHFPTHSIGYQYFAGFGVPSLVPNDYDTHFVIHLGDANRAGEAPLLSSRKRKETQHEPSREEDQVGEEVIGHNQTGILIVAKEEK